MKNGILMVTALAGIGCALAGVLMLRNHNAERDASPLVTIREIDEESPATQPVVAYAAPTEAPSADAPPAGAAPVVSPAGTSKRAAPAPPDKPIFPKARSAVRVQKRAPATPAPAPEKPIAREALALVGVDPTAEEIWVAAINSPDTSAHDRSDLIEDLNEEGFDDPKNITVDDLPLIEKRIALIEELGPQAMDDTNAAAFAEAYKDLLNMRAKVAGQ